jgi:succinate-acetate transporter protein
MDAPERGALMLVRFIAAALIGWTIVELVLYWAVCDHNHTAMQALPCILKLVPLLLGITVLIKAKALAEWISNILDD